MGNFFSPQKKRSFSRDFSRRPAFGHGRLGHPQSLEYFQCFLVVPRATVKVIFNFHANKIFYEINLWACLDFIHHRLLIIMAHIYWGEMVNYHQMLSGEATIQPGLKSGPPQKLHRRTDLCRKVGTISQEGQF